MPDFRVHAPAPSGDEVRLSPEESHHLVVVNRARAGDPVVVFDGRGTEWTCELTDARKAGATLRIRSARTLPALPCALTLAQALPKGGVMDDIVRHATELGTARVVPLQTERTQVHLDGDRSDKKIDKWRTAALEAAKQCGNPFVPEITAQQTLGFFLKSEVVRDAELRLIASLHAGAKSLKAVLADFRERNVTGLVAADGSAANVVGTADDSNAITSATGKHATGNSPTRSPKSVVWLVGPEGDFSPTEMAAALAAGFEPVTLGPLVLRCDTAATAALSVLSYETQR